MTPRINAVWLLTWEQPNTGNYETINEKVNGILAIHGKWRDITEFTHWSRLVLFNTHVTHRRQKFALPAVVDSCRAVFLCFLRANPLTPFTTFTLSEDHTWSATFESAFPGLLGCQPLWHSIHWRAGLQLCPADL